MRHTLLSIGFLTLAPVAAAHAADHPIKTLMQTYLDTQAPADFGAIRIATTQGVVDEGLSFCLDRTPAQIVQDLPNLKSRLEAFGSRGEILTAMDGAFTDVTFWGDGEETLARIHNLPEFTEFLSLTTFMDVQVRDLGDTLWVYCSITDSSEDAPKTTDKAKEWVAQLAPFQTGATDKIEDFNGPKHQYNAGQWGSSAWAVRTEGDQRFYSVTANEINVTFEYHRIIDN